jgi:hypothetical protein
MIWIIGIIWIIVGFTVSFVWHAIVVTGASAKLTDSFQRIEEAEEYDDTAKVHLGALVHRKLAKRAYKRPWWLYILAPWLIFTARLPPD